ncbi:MAG: glycoside hydrolase family 172 protein [Acidobacteriota bacterium]
MLRFFGLFALLLSIAGAADGDLARRRKDAETRWVSFENPTGAKGQAARENRGAKGHPFDSLKAGETKTLLNVEGAGSVRRIWLTIQNRSPKMLRSLRLEMFWDHASEPAVSAPLGDFFGAILGRLTAFDNELFSSPEGRSFNCVIPMPFRKGAKITLTNESGVDVPELFYQIDYVATPKPDEDSLYFHAYFNRVRWTNLGEDFEFLPRVRGEGRFLGVHFGVITNPVYTGWWGEGEVKMYVDGDTALPTLSGTGAEDYIGTGWGQGVFRNRYQGCLLADDKLGQYSSYRYHVPDPVYFHKDLRVTIQSLGGEEKAKVLEMLAKGAPLKPVTIGGKGTLIKLLELDQAPDLASPKFPDDAWINSYRRDDWSSVAFFYLDSPVNGLPKIAPVEKRVEGLE